jgi:hypothetical protein
MAGISESSILATGQNHLLPTQLVTKHPRSHALNVFSGVFVHHCGVTFYCLPMWLINVRTRQIEEFVGLDVPPYAILSHTWNKGGEVTFQELTHPERAATAASHEVGWLKIDHTCRQAAEDGLDYAWVDTCCIDKSSSAELSEAINSMFRWYKRAAVCYTFLQDLDGFSCAGDKDTGQLQASVGHCRWFTRSWTLQELIAPLHMKFFDKDWKFCFTKAVASKALSNITAIDVSILRHEKDLSAVSVAQKMSWAGTRQATRKEDVAYSLLGIFAINMPLLYGEEERAFLRLQAEIINSCPDTTIFAWTSSRDDMGKTLEDPWSLKKCSGVIASSPAFFRPSSCADMTSLSGVSPYDFSMSNRGIKLRAQFGMLPIPGTNKNYLVLPVCRMGGRVLAIRVRNTGGSCFVRQGTHCLFLVQPRGLAHRLVLEPYLLKEIPLEATQKSIIMSSRHRVLEVVLPPGMEIYGRWPWKDWDEQHAVFFGPSRPPEDLGWASLKIGIWPGQPFSNPDDTDSIDLLFYAFGWASDPKIEGPPRCTVHRVRGAADDLVLEQMNREAVRNSWNAYWVNYRLQVHNVPEQPFMVVGKTKRDALVLLYEISCVEDAEKCPNPFWRVKFSLHVAPHVEVPALSSRDWRGINWGELWHPFPSTLRLHM